MNSVIFLLVTFSAVGLFYFGTGKDRSVLFFFLFWIITAGTLSYAGFFEKTTAFPPRFLFVLAPSIAAVIYFYRKLNTSNLGLQYLLAVHVLRLPIELILFQLFLLGEIPVIMTYKGWNLDILVGISAAILLLYSVLAKRRINSRIFIAWNIAGLVFLAIIIFTAILSSPSPIQVFGFENPNVAILKFPYTFLPAVVVPIVLLSHLLCLKNRHDVM